MNRDLEYRVARLESRLKIMNEAEDFSEKEKIFTFLCKSCNLTDVSFRGKMATCKFDMANFYRRIMKRMHLQYKEALKAQIGKECKLVCNMETQEWTISVGKDTEMISYNIVPQPGDAISLKKENRRILLACIGPALERLLDKMNESALRKSKWKFNESEDSIRRVGNKWKILKNDKREYWNAEYSTRDEAMSALQAYIKNKNECRKHTEHLVVEGFLSDVGKNLIRNLQSFLAKIFGRTLYFDHYTDKSVDLFYKGDEVAEIFYNDKNEEIVIMPRDTEVAPVSFYDTSEAEIKDFLSDLILGDLNPEFA